MTDVDAFDITVPGIPVGQGSKTLRRTRTGGHVVREDNPHTQSWRESVARAALDVTKGRPIAGPVEVVCEFVFPRPQAHYRTGKHADELRDSAPYWHTSKPDLDKLMRAIGDALTGTVLRDDSQIATWEVCKRYVDHERDTGPHAAIFVRSIR